MDIRKAKLVVTKGGSGSSTFRVTIPTNWIRKMGLSEDNRNLKLEFGGKQIIIINNEEEIKMLGKLLEMAKIEIKNEMDRLGYIDDSDNTDRFLDNLASNLLEENMEDEDMIEDLKYDLLEEITSYMKKTYKEKGEVNERGDYAGCYYKDKEGLKKWSEFGE